jgi:hypothetical protein
VERVPRRSEKKRSDEKHQPSGVEMLPFRKPRGQNQTGERPRREQTLPDVGEKNSDCRAQRANCWNVEACS